MVFFLVGSCRFCGKPDGDVHLFWGECTFPPLVEICENPEFHDLMRMDQGHRPRCVFALAWLTSNAVWCSWCLPLGS